MNYLIGEHLSRRQFGLSSSFGGHKSRAISDVIYLHVKLGTFWRIKADDQPNNGALLETKFNPVWTRASVELLEGLSVRASLTNF
jgi:hypothetical protein